MPKLYWTLKKNYGTNGEFFLAKKKKKLMINQFITIDYHATDK